ncbi:alpha/beta fold hydrolase [Nitratidesulfovibrio sp. HK-II]|uniref:alpha/beta fold hydrolase n=1 Tax=Nitratidesulfovibrio sp. HK-II TaxID=2009266 RepID=UPI000E2F1A26|nr:alpha/beta fold hydrolase [Nitratidesulfovibrio sp. HK-II]GBO97289.1 probable peptide synthetase [Nitratidesulfovibrio sp. HK-II]
MMKLSDFKLDPTAMAAAPSDTPGRPGAPGDAPTLEALFRDMVSRNPEGVALTDDVTSLSFGRLDEFSATIAGFILSRGYGAEAAVGVLCERGARYLAAALGVLRAGAVYVPVERDLSPARQEAMLRPVRMIVTDSRCLREAEYYRYRNPGIRDVLCIDLAGTDGFLEKGTGLGSTAYWEGVTEAGSDLGWKSWFDGQPLPGDMLAGMAAGILAATGLAERPRRRVLDVGCGSGAVAGALAGVAELYTAVDIARNELDRLGCLGASTVVKGHQMEAVDICFLSGVEYDLVCLNGVAENFPGYNYLRRVLDHALRLLADDGTLFVGAVRDLDGRDAFRAALVEHAGQTGESAGLLRLDSGAELFVPERFFVEWAAHSPVPVRVSVCRHDAAHRDVAHCYDVVISRGNPAASDVPTGQIGPTASTAQPTERPLYGMEHARQLPPPKLPAVAPEQAAYIVYTSGSTGMPKGVVVEHRNLLHIIAALREYSSGCRKAALVAPLSFDASIQQLAVSLFCGKPLHVMSDEARKSPERFCASVRRHGVDLCDMTPAFFNVLVEHLHARREPLPMARLLLAGEVLRPDAIRKFYAIPGNEAVVLFNVYGPTECTVDSSAFRIDHGNHAAYSAYPIGRPLAGVEVTIRDRDGKPLPDSVTGELWISGAGVSRGYLNGESPGAFVTAEGRPCYRTGDYGHVRDGLLHYAGREDQQVKIRGNRVEIGEVENAIAGFPGVRQVAVVADTFSAQEGKSLAAYVVGDVDAAALRAYLEGQLPSYCVPAHYVPMVELPFSVNRKVDRKALPSPLAGRRMVEGRRPEGDMEERLAAIWKRLLGTDVADADASFFSLGGNSIMAIRLAAMVEKELGVHVAVNELFTHPSIALLAGLIAGKGGTRNGPVIRLCRREGGKNLFLFHPVGGSVFCYSHLAETLGGACTVYAVEAAGFSAEKTALNTELHRVEDLAEYYLGEILKAETEDIVFGGWSFGGLVAYEAACRYAAMGNDPGPVLILDSVADNRRAMREAAKDDVELLKHLMQDTLPFDEAVLRSLPREEKLAYLVRRGESTGLLPEGFSAVQMDNLLRTYRGNAIAAARYDRPTPSDLRVLLVRALDFTGNQHIVPDDDHQGWSRFLRPENITLRWTEGTHESMLSPGLAGNVAKHILEYLDHA